MRVARPGTIPAVTVPIISSAVRRVSWRLSKQRRRPSKRLMPPVQGVALGAHCLAGATGVPLLGPGRRGCPVSAKGAHACDASPFVAHGSPRMRPLTAHPAAADNISRRAPMLIRPAIAATQLIRRRRPGHRRELLRGVKTPRRLTSFRPLPFLFLHVRTRTPPTYRSSDRRYRRSSSAKARIGV
jgi:hypothetical protein